MVSWEITTGRRAANWRLLNHIIIWHRLSICAFFNVRVTMSKESPDFEEGKITVAVRCRPFNEREKTLNSGSCLQFSEGARVSIYEQGVPNEGATDADMAKGHPFTFDHAYTAKIPQEQVYQDVGRPVLLASFAGFNTCIFAYGQTGSGKSYAMMGPTGPNARDEAKGIIPRLCNDLFSEVALRTAAAEEAYNEAAAGGAQEFERPPQISFHVKVSYLEIYQENVKCLLNSKRDKLKVRQHPVMGVYVENLTEIHVSEYGTVEDLLNLGAGSRHVASTNMNDASSRSHAIFTIIIAQKRTTTTKDGSQMVAEIKSKINLVDLAGSERAKSTGAEGETLREGAQINKSLSTLGLVISGLAEQSKKTPGGKAPFIPYRDSMLTWLLKESLGGNSKTFMLSTLSPATINYEETMSTLRYADRAKSIVTRACVNENPSDKKVRELEEEIGRLRNYIKQMSSPENVETPKLSQAELLEQLEEAQKFISREKLSEEAREEEEERDLAEVTESIQQRRMVVAPKAEPYLLNIDNIGGWVLQELVDHTTYLGTAELDEPIVGTRCILVSGEEEDLEGIGPQHCCFVREENTTNITLRPLPGYETFVDQSENPLEEEVLLNSGQTVHIGDGYLTFKLVDPSVAPLTARVRRAARRQTAASPATPSQSALTPSLSPVQSPTSSQAVLPQATPDTDETPRNTPATERSRQVSNGESPKSSPQEVDLAATASPKPMLPTLKLPSSAPQHVDPEDDDQAPHPHVTNHPLPPLKTPNVAARSAVSINEDVVHLYRHTYIAVGDLSCGKSATVVNLSKEDRWFPFFKKEVPATKPTFSVETSTVQAATTVGPKVDLTFLEVGGHPSFTALQPLLPDRRVSYILCFRLMGDECSLAKFRDTLEYLLCRSNSTDTTIVLLGTHKDLSPLSAKDLVGLLTDLENEIAQFFRMRQPNVNQRPRVVGKFAVSNLDRSVIPAGATGAHISKFPDLLQWLADHAHHRCKADVDFPNGAIPSRALSLARKVVETRRNGIWCIPSSDYKKMAKETDIRYEKGTDQLHQHTQLLQSWGLLHHHFRHLHLKRTIILDVPWVLKVLATISCCIPSAPSHDLLASYDRGESLSQYSLSSPSIVKFAEALPFFVSDVREKDPKGLITLGILTMDTLHVLLMKLTQEKNYEVGDIEPVLELLESYDMIIRGSRLRPTWASYFPADLVPTVEDLAEGLPQGRESDEGTELEESFYLMPVCFQAQAPVALTLHVPPLLFGPSYKFQLNMVPTHFFPRFVSRVSRYADQLYLGPATLSNGAASFAEEGYGPHTTVSGAMWRSCVWIVSSSESRALVRMVNNSLYITFHDHAGDHVFHEGLRDVVHCLVAESPGAQCQELILCRPSADSSDEVWIEKTANLNSIERTLEKEQQALRTARGAPPPMEERMDNGPIPLIRPQDQPFSASEVLDRLRGDCVVTDEVMSRIKAALELVEMGRELEDRDVGVDLEGKGMDFLVDALAHSKLP